MERVAVAKDRDPFCYAGINEVPREHLPWKWPLKKAGMGVEVRVHKTCYPRFS
jgi:hypothetical protein